MKIKTSIDSVVLDRLRDNFGKGATIVGLIMTGWALYQIAPLFAVGVIVTLGGMSLVDAGV